MINIAEILKDVPKGTMLYSTTHGYVRFDEVICKNESNLYPINCHDIHGGGLGFTKDGRWSVNCEGECVLFPSKEQRDWSKFQRPFNDGDILYVKTSYSEFIFIYKNDDIYNIYDHVAFSKKGIFYCSPSSLCHKDTILKIRLATKEEKQKLFDVIKANGYRWNSEFKTIEEIIEPKFKIGDRVKKNKDYISGIVTDIFDDSFKVTYDSGSCCYIQFDYQCDWELVHEVPKFKVGDKIRSKVTGCEFTITEIDDNSSKVTVECTNRTFSFFKFCDYNDYELIPVEPKFKVGDKIYKKNWNSYIKINEITDSFYIDENNAFRIPIEKQDEYELYLEKFDITTLKPFDKVLVRDKDENIWRCDFFSHINKNAGLPFKCISNWRQCIPYEGNEHLVGTSNECDDFYINW